MPTPGERRALVFLAALAALGVSVRTFTELRGPAPVSMPGDRAALARQIAAVDSAIAVGGEKRRARAPRGAAPSARREPAVAAADTAPRAPRQRRERADPPPRPLDESRARRRPPARSEAGVLPEPRRRASSVVRAPVDLDTAPIDEIAALPAIGPALARRIVTDRIEHGPFGSISGLERVQGISRSLARRFEPYVTFSLPPGPGAGVAPAPVSQKRRPPV